MYPQRQEEHASGWFYLGAVSLAGLAGLTNSAAIGLGGLAVSHLTGSISRVSAELSAGYTRNILPFTVVRVALFLGAVGSVGEGSGGWQGGMAAGGGGPGWRALDS